MSEIEEALLAATVVAPSKSDGKITAAYRLPASFPSFQGHFPGSPICPAVVQSRAALASIAPSFAWAKGLRTKHAASMPGR